MEKTYTKFWKKIANEKNVSTKDIITHAALKAFFAKSTNNGSKEEIFRSLLSKSFTPTTNKNKLANGCTEWNAIRVAFDEMRWWTNTPIFGLTRKEILDNIFGTEKRYEEFNVFFKTLLKTKQSFKKRYYTYIFVDQNKVEPIYQAVQAAHVAMVIGQKMSKSFDASNIYFQVCKLPKDTKLGLLSDTLEDRGFETELFYESDIDDYIAMGTHPVASYKRGCLKDFELLKF